MNLFNFEYSIKPIMNHDQAFTKDGKPTASRFSTVIGDRGMVVHNKKKGYEVVTTDALSKIGEAFINKGHTVKSFVHRNGERIGLTIDLTTRPTKVGEKNYQAIIDVPNNGGGMGYFSLKEVRLVCLNGMTRKLSESKGGVKIPHNFTYKQALSLVEKSIIQFVDLLKLVEAEDEKMNAKKIEAHEARLLLNKWFWQNELQPSDQKEMSLSEFRRTVSTTMDMRKPLVARYNQLMSAFSAEKKYNAELSLDLSLYTVFATVTNYLSRRREASKRNAPEEVKLLSTEEKVRGFVKQLLEMA